MSAAACPLCGRPTDPRFIRPPWEVRRCAGCRLELTTGDWPAARARAFYGTDYFVGPEEAGYADYAALGPALRRTAERRLRSLPRGARLLDVGCASGDFLGVARDRFAGVVGADISTHACRRAAACGLPVVVTDARTLPFAAAQFDAVTLWDTIEHLSDPGAAFAEVARVLRPGGMVVLTTGDVESWCRWLSGHHWHLYNLPEHRYFFSRPALERLLNQAGLRLVSCHREGAWYPLAYLLERLAKTVLRGRVGGWRHGPRLRAAMLYVNLFDILLVQAVKAPDAAGG